MEIWKENRKEKKKVSLLKITDEMSHEWLSLLQL